MSSNSTYGPPVEKKYAKRKKCPKCEKDVDESATVCPYCGANL